MGLNRYEGLLYPCIRVDLLSLNYNIKKAEMILNSGTSVIHLSLRKGVEKSTIRIVGRGFITGDGENIGNGLLAFFEYVGKSIKKKKRWLERSVKETKTVRKYVSVGKDSKLTYLSLKWLEQGKSRKYREKIVVLTRNSFRIIQGDNKYTRVDKTNLT